MAKTWEQLSEDVRRKQLEVVGGDEKLARIRYQHMIGPQFRRGEDADARLVEACEQMPGIGRLITESIIRRWSKTHPGA